MSCTVLSPPLPSCKVEETAERFHEIPIGSHHHYRKLINVQKQTVYFTIDRDIESFEENVASRVYLETKLGRFLLDRTISIHPDAQQQLIESNDYSFTRYPNHSDTTILLPLFVNYLGFNVMTRNWGKTWEITEFLFDNVTQ